MFCVEVAQYTVFKRVNVCVSFSRGSCSTCAGAFLQFRGRRNIFGRGEDKIQCQKPWQGQHFVLLEEYRELRKNHTP